MLSRAEDSVEDLSSKGLGKESMKEPGESMKDPVVDEGLESAFLLETPVFLCCKKHKCIYLK